MHREVLSWMSTSPFWTKIDLIPGWHYDFLYALTETDETTCHVVNFIWSASQSGDRFFYLICILRSTQNDDIITSYSNLDFCVIPRLINTAHVDVVISIANAPKCIAESCFCRMSGEGGSIDLIIDVVLHDILHVSSLSFIWPVANPAIFYILWPLNTLTNLRQKGETIIDVISCGSHERFQEILFAGERQRRVEALTIFEETLECGSEEMHEDIFDDVH